MYLHVYYLCKTFGLSAKGPTENLFAGKKKKNNNFNILRYDIHESSFPTVPVCVS